ncbi:MAG: hypothetical protein ACLSF7_01700 [Acutalibacteraceae bacterium]
MFCQAQLRRKERGLGNAAEIFRIVHAEFKNLCHAPARGEACAAIRLLWIIIEPEAFKGAEIQWVAFVNLLVGEAAQEFLWQVQITPFAKPVSLQMGQV